MAIGEKQPIVHAYKHIALCRLKKDVKASQPARLCADVYFEDAGSRNRFSFVLIGPFVDE